MTELAETHLGIVLFQRMLWFPILAMCLDNSDIRNAVKFGFACWAVEVSARNGANETDHCSAGRQAEEVHRTCMWWLGRFGRVGACWLSVELMQDYIPAGTRRARPLTAGRQVRIDWRKDIIDESWVEDSVLEMGLNSTCKSYYLYSTDPSGELASKLPKGLVRCPGVKRTMGTPAWKPPK